MKNRLLFFLFWVGFVINGFAQQGWPPLYEIKTDTTVLTLDTTHFQVLEDVKGDLPFEQVRQSASFHYDSYYNPSRKSHVCWLRMRIKNTLPRELNLYLCDFYSSYLDIYWLDAHQQWQHQRTGELIPGSQLPDRKGNKERNRLLVTLLPGQETTIYQRSENLFWQQPLSFLLPKLQPEAHRIQSVYKQIQIDNGWKEYFFGGIMIGILFLAICYNLFIFISIRDRVYLYFSICLIFFTLDRNASLIQLAFFDEQPYIFRLLANFFFIIFFIFFIQSIRNFIRPAPNLKGLNNSIIAFLALTTLVNLFQFFAFLFPTFPIYESVILIEFLIRIVYALCIVLTLKMLKRGSEDARFVLLATLPLFVFWTITLIDRLTNIYFEHAVFRSLWDGFGYIESFCFAWLILFFSGALINRYNLVRKRVTQQAIEKEQLEKEREIERNRIIASQNERLEQQVKERTAQLQSSLESLKVTQNQLVQKEKLASLGELTAGIAHEIQNPLNFVNNFSDVTRELFEEMQEELRNGSLDEALLLADDIQQNLQKINHHGQRADSIVKNMLEHSRSSGGEKQLTDLNALVNEYLKLAHHGMRAKSSDVNVKLVTDFASELEPVKVVPQDLGRVLLNLYNNAFYAVLEKQRQADPTYTPTVTVTTRKMAQFIEIRVTDNGTGIPEGAKQKIFQPFFTTKPTGQGTGLGLSLSYDIVTKGHGGQLEVETTEGEGTQLVIRLPL
ncbi:sensor histidine kinase [Tellurirhabdus bombi]|uniref:sensor histidine kinase n=1 Tax=Tellurirhabdus bombi TaxID=2907205 RepID=UPI001F20DD2D|nr:ATP-binding protein [Tellurirhabdus bombi]